MLNAGSDVRAPQHVRVLRCKLHLNSVVWHHFEKECDVTCVLYVCYMCVICVICVIHWPVLDREFECHAHAEQPCRRNRLREKT